MMNFQIELKHKNWILLFSYLLVWIACCVEFGAPLHTASISYPNGFGGSISYSLSFYQNGVSGGGSFVSYKNLASSSSPYQSKCNSGGSGTTFLAAITFLALIAGIVMRILYMFNWQVNIPYIGNNSKLYSRI